jgi:hypothetical protein
MKMSFQHMVRGGLVISLVMACIGCGTIDRMLHREAPPDPGATTPVEAQPKTSGIEPKSKPEKPSYYVHKVRWQGESLSIIAAWYTGNLDNWKVLAETNPSLNPNRIFPGSKISIPQEMMKTQEPMPEEFVAGFLPKPKEGTSSAAPTPQEEETQELELFGPKELPQQ